MLARSLPVVLVLSASTLAADPRWWTHDHQVTFNTPVKSNPDVALVSFNSTTDIAVYLTWEQESAGGRKEVWLDASFDGCTFCGPVLWASDPAESSLLPRVAVEKNVDFLPPRLSVQVVFERAGKVYVAADASMTTLSGPSALCAAFRALATPVPRRDVAACARS